MTVNYINFIMIEFIHIPKNAGSLIEQLCEETDKINYNGHNIDPFQIKSDKKQLIIIRNPIDRFCSAVRYAIQKYSDSDKIKKLISLDIITPEQWISVLKNKKHKYYKFLNDEITNESHYIGDKLLKLKWTYSDQYLWINKPKYIILFENLDIELNQLLEKENIKFSGKFEKINNTEKNDFLLSEKSIIFLEKMYKKDLKLYNYYKSIDLNIRINGLEKNIKI
jgi:hypothetical protein